MVTKMSLQLLSMLLKKGIKSMNSWNPRLRPMILIAEREELVLHGFCMRCTQEECSEPN